MDPTYGGRVHHENEQAVGDALGDAMAEAAWPGVFSGGKQIVRTYKSKMGDFDVLRIGFNDGSEMNIVGKFEVRYKQPRRSDEELAQAARELMSGDFEVDDEGVLDPEDLKP